MVLKRVAEEQSRTLVDEKLTALMDAEAEAISKLDERLDELEEKAEKQLEILDRVYNGIGSIGSAM